MFTGLPEQASYEDPWFTTFEERFASFCKQNQRVAYFYERPDSSTFRYRVFNMVEAINRGSTELSAGFFTADELPAMERVLEVADTLVLCRVSYSDRINRLVMQARAANCRVIFDVDDLIFDLDQAPQVLNTLDENFSDHMSNVYYGYIARVGAVLKLCDEVIVTNLRLAEHVAEFAQLKVHVLPNFLNDAQVSLSLELFELKKQSGFARDKHLHVGYFSGSPTHNRDFAIVLESLIRLLKNDSRIVLRLGGYLDVPELEAYAHRIERLPLMDFLNLQIVQAKTEINLVPLRNNDFTDCKSDLKYFESGIVGSLSIASPAFAYRHSIIDGSNGYLATAEEWDSKIEAVIGKLSCGYSEMAEKAFRDCLDRYTRAAQIPLIEKVLRR